MIDGRRFDYILVGGGLANGLIALALRRFQPEATVVIVEKEATVGGNHTWSFHDTDLPAGSELIVEPLVKQRWPAYDVAFPDHVRTVSIGYSTFNSDCLRSALRTAAADSNGRLTIISKAAAETVLPHRVILADGRKLEAHVVVDARGPRPGGTGVGYQKFVGHEIEVEASHGIERPLIMDARVAQHDGFRFVYVLPLAPDRLLVEDTYFSSTPDLDLSTVRGRILEQTRIRGWKVARIVREECGVLPMPWRSHPNPDSNVVMAGYAAGLFHPTTGYSFPMALKLALAVAAQDAPGRVATDLMPKFRAAHQRCTVVLRFLNWMMFNAVAPTARWRLLSRFYRLPVDTIGRFYAAELTASDLFRLFSGPIPRGLSPRAIIKAWEAQI